MLIDPKILRRIFFLAMLAILLAHPVMSADNSDIANAQQYYALAMKGDAGAREKLCLLAQQGNALAQNNLGAMYAFGWGVAEDDAEGLKWYTKSAEQGYAPAQYKVASMYAFGQGAPRDYAKAYMWASLSVEHHNVNGIELHDRLEQVMTPEQITKGKKLLSEWKRRHEKESPQ